MIRTYVVPDGTEAQRIDKYLADGLGVCTRSQLKTRFRGLTVNGKQAKLSRLIKAGDSICFDLADETAASDALVPENIPLDIIYENDELLVVNKAQGMVVHPACGNRTGTLANALLGRLSAAGASLGSAPPRAGLVHRLDKDTSGILVAAKHAAAQEALAAQFRARSVKKTYIAIVHGAPKTQSGRIETYLARDPRSRKRFAPSPEGVGKHALTRWQVLDRSERYALVALYPHTGRTHQLRVHCKALGCPIVGDPIYGMRCDSGISAALMLHAYRLCIRLPPFDAEPVTFTAPLPERFYRACDEFCLNICRI